MQQEKTFQFFNHRYQRGLCIRVLNRDPETFCSFSSSSLFSHRLSDERFKPTTLLCVVRAISASVDMAWAYRTLKMAKNTD